MAIIKAMHFSA